MYIYDSPITLNRSMIRRYARGGIREKERGGRLLFWGKVDDINTSGPRLLVGFATGLGWLPAATTTTGTTTIHDAVIDDHTRLAGGVVP